MTSIPYDFLNPFALPYLIVSVLILILGIFVFSHNTKSLTHWSYLCLCVSGFLWLISNYAALSCTADRDALFWAKFVYIGITLIPPSMYFFSVAWLEQFPQKKLGVALNYGLGFVFIGFFLFTDLFVVGVYRYFFGYFSKLSIWCLLYLAYFFFVSASFFRNMAAAYKRETIPMKKIHIRRVLVAFVIAFVGSLDFWVTFGVPVYPISFLTLSLFAGIVAHAIIYYRLMDIETVVHKTLMWLAASSLVFLPIVVLVYLLQPWYRKADAFQVSILCGVIFYLLTLYLRFVQPAVDHLFQRRQWDLARTLEKFTDELVHLKTLEEVVRHILHTVETVFYAQHMSLLIRKEGEDIFEMTPSGACQPGYPLNIRNEFFSWLEEHDVLVPASEAALDPAFEGIRSCVQTHFRAFKAVLAVPMVVNRRLIAVLNLGQKKNLQRYRPSEINFLSELRRPAAIALANAFYIIAIHENLQKWNIELEKKVAERTEELQKTQAQLVQAEKLATIGTLAGGVAHEINNPLTAILTNAQLLLLDMTDESGQESLRLIEQATQRCRTIVKKLMVYARQPGEVIELQKVDLAKAVRDTVDFLEYQFQQENIRIVTHFEKTDPVRANLNEIEQVLTNILLNARDAIKAKQAEGNIEIALSQTGSFLCLKIRDDGIGIPADKLSKIFDPFYTTKDIGKGTGLGLSICQAIVDKYEGSISAESRVGEGATFKIELPAIGASGAESGG